MSPVSNGNGKSTPGSLQDSPIPLGPVMHCVALLSEGQLALRRFLEAIGERLAPLGEIRPEPWVVVQEPRECTYTDLHVGEWSFRLIYDPAGLPDSVRQAVLAGKHDYEADESLDSHTAGCLIFLTGAPKLDRGWDRFHALCRVAWSWVDAGATMISFPEAQANLARRIFLNLEPERLEPSHAYLFLSNGLAHKQEKQGEETIFWLRTWGMAQFALPDLAVGLPSPKEAELESLRLLFETLPPAMIADQGILPVGGVVQIGERTWTAIGPPAPHQLPFLQSRYGIQLFV